VTNPQEAFIRPATPADVPAIWDMIVELAVYELEPDAVAATAADIDRALFATHPSAFAIIAESEGHLVGFALWFPSFSTWEGRCGMWLEDLYVRPSHRKTGLGRALLNHLANICVEQGLTRMEWWVLNWNDLAKDFYDRIGAEPMDEWTRRRLDVEGITHLAGIGPERG